MLSQAEISRIYQQAYVPEHLPHYVTAISNAEAHLHGDFICFTRRRHLIFIGYPLGNRQADPSAAYASACKRYRPSSAAIIAPKIWLSPDAYEQQPSDSYYRIELPMGSHSSAVAYMVRRAQKELTIKTGRFNKEHQQLIDGFLKRRVLDPTQIRLIKQIPQYLKQSPSGRLLEVRKRKVLVAFTVVETGSREYAFYLFNFRSNEINIPGASDLLFDEMLKLAHAEDKRAINLGLGIHPGVRRFKEKWGGVPFLSYQSALVHLAPLDLGALAGKL